jgi:NADP-reducing hydrogenase subunit HndB
MPRLNSVEDLRSLREAAKKDRALRNNTGTRIIVGMATCGIAAGAEETRAAIVAELEKRDIDAQVSTVGCIGICSKEPLVDIERAGHPRVTYSNVRPDMVPRLIEEHLVHGHVVEEWAMGRLPSEGLGEP